MVARLSIGRALDSGLPFVGSSPLSTPWHYLVISEVGDRILRVNYPGI